MAGLYQEVQRQAKMLAFCDDYRFFTIVFLLLLPLVFLMRRLPRLPWPLEEPEVEALPYAIAVAENSRDHQSPPA